MTLEEVRGEGGTRSAEEVKLGERCRPRVALGDVSDDPASGSVSAALSICSRCTSTSAAVGVGVGVSVV